MGWVVCVAAVVVDCLALKLVPLVDALLDVVAAVEVVAVVRDAVEEVAADVAAKPPVSTTNAATLTPAAARRDFLAGWGRRRLPVRGAGTRAWGVRSVVSMSPSWTGNL